MSWRLRKAQVAQLLVFAFPLAEDQTNIPQKLGILKNRKGGLGKIDISLDKRSLRVEERTLEDKVESFKNNGQDNWFERDGQENII